MQMTLEYTRRYSPRELLQLEPLLSSALPQAERQSLIEGLTAALLFLAIDQQGETGSLQLVDSRQAQVPDVWLHPKLDPALPTYLQDRQAVPIEVVNFTPYSRSEGLISFFFRTKLLPSMAYPPGTKIVARSDVPLKHADFSARRIARALADKSIPHEIYLVSLCTQGDYYVAQLYPEWHELSQHPDDQHPYLELLRAAKV